MAELLVFEAKLKKPLTYADFDTKILKKTFRQAGGEIRKIARRLVSRRTVSRVGEFPGRDTGMLRKSILAKVSRSGFSVGVASYPITGMDVFYPPFVYWGHRGPGSDRDAKGAQDSKQTGKRRSGKKVAQARKNYIIEAANRYGQTKYQQVMEKVLVDAIKPGLITK